MLSLGDSLLRKIWRYCEEELFTGVCNGDKVKITYKAQKIIKSVYVGIRWPVLNATPRKNPIQVSCTLEFQISVAIQTKISVL